MPCPGARIPQRPAPANRAWKTPYKFAIYRDHIMGASGGLAPSASKLRFPALTTVALSTGLNDVDPHPSSKHGVGSSSHLGRGSA